MDNSERVEKLANAMILKTFLDIMFFNLKIRHLNLYMYLLVLGERLRDKR